MNFDIKRIQQIAGAIFIVAIILIFFPIFFSSDEEEKNKPIEAIGESQETVVPAFVAKNESDSSQVELLTDNKDPTIFDFHKNTTDELVNGKGDPSATAIPEFDLDSEIESSAPVETVDDAIISQEIWKVVEESNRPQESQSTQQTNNLGNTSPLGTTSPSAEQENQKLTTVTNPVKPKKTTTNQKQENLPTLNLIAESETNVVRSPISEQARVTTRRYYVQIGAFANPENARKESQRLQLENLPVVIESAGGSHRVRLGPYHTKEQAENIRKQREAKGQPARIISVP